MYKEKEPNKEIPGIVELYLQFKELYDKNMFAAKEKYLGTIVRANGKIEDIRELNCEHWVDADDIVIVVDISEMPGYSFRKMKWDWSIHCLFNKKNMDQVVKLVKGKHVTIHGKFGISSSIYPGMYNCTVVDCETE